MDKRHFANYNKCAAAPFAVAGEVPYQMKYHAEVDPTAFVAPDADLVGHVRIGRHCSVYFHAVLRAETAEIVVGDGSNLQDGVIVHTDPGSPVHIGKNVTVGHGAILHGCTIGDGSLIGMGAIVLNGAVLGKNCRVGAGALVTEGKSCPDNTMLLGSPARAVHTLTSEEAAKLTDAAGGYQTLIERYKKEFDDV